MSSLPIKLPDIEVKIHAAVTYDRDELFQQLRDVLAEPESVDRERRRKAIEGAIEGIS